jgi:TonB family protein
MRAALSVAAVFTIAFTIGVPLARATDAADNTLAEAQGLYAQASYEQALAVLDRLDPARAATLEDAQRIRQYRALCLLALGRSADTERAVEDLVRADPTAAASDDLPPRLQTLHQQVRERVVRELVRRGYERGRDLYGLGQFDEATKEFTRVVSLIDDQTLGMMKDPGYADLRLLADGFVRLASAARPAEPAPTGTARAVSAGDASVVVPGEATRRVDRGLVPPEPIYQDVPPFPKSATALLSRNEGELEVEVGADGKVLNAKVVVSMHPIYDAMLAAAARTWKYHPARRDGEPVPYTKRVRVRLQLK